MQAQAAGRLHHPHIVTVFDAGRVHNIGTGMDVSTANCSTSRARRLPTRRFAGGDIAARVADAVEHAHSRGVPHGHLAPSRIYLQEPDKVPKVMGSVAGSIAERHGDFELAGTQAMLPYFQNELGSEARRKIFVRSRAAIHVADRNTT